MRKAKGTFWARFSIILLAILFGILTYWFSGYLLDDIRVIRMPDRNAFFEEHTDPSLEVQLNALKAKMRDLEHQHTLLNQQRGFIIDSSSSLKITVDNLFTLKNRDQELISKDQFDRVLQTLDKIIEIQGNFEKTADRYIQVTNEKFALQKQIEALEKRINDEHSENSRNFADMMHRHRIKVAIARMVILIPLVILCTVFFVKKRKSIYRLIYASGAVALYIKMFLFVHEYFPSRYFKYILLFAMLGLVGWAFGWLVRRLVKPKVDVLLKQYREAYERFLCPVCEYPIRTGPRKYLYWTRRTVHKTALSSGLGDSACAEEAYTCPSCGTTLFEKCGTCGKISHSLLPSCQHCGAKREISGDKY